ncbi:MULTISPECIES: LytTR family DNA-binding domain-containing protein [Paracoccus]|nr:LytTR family DNA-binding domain-containing protein [Paracoccus pantotrophus]
MAGLPKNQLQAPADPAPGLSAGVKWLNSPSMINEKTDRVKTDMSNSAPSARDMRSSRLADSRINVVLLTGRRLSVTSAQSWSVVTDRHFLIFYAISGVLVTYLYPVPIEPQPPWWEFVIVFGAMVLFFYVVLVAVLLLMEKACRRWPRLVVPVPLITLIALLATLGFSRVYNPVMVGPAWSNFKPLTEEFVLIYFVILNLEILFSIFVLPRTRAFAQSGWTHWDRIRSEAPAEPAAPNPAEARPWLPPPQAAPQAALQAAPQLPAPMPSTSQQGPAAHQLPVPMLRQPPPPPVPPPPRTVRFGSYSWPVSALRLIRAEEHYIRIITKEQEVLVRYRLSDAVSQLPEDAGMRVHRSYWLSYDAIVDHAPLPDSRLLLTLWNGSTVTVPRAHRKRLEAAFAAGLHAGGRD